MYQQVLCEGLLANPHISHSFVLNDFHSEEMVQLSQILDVKLLGKRLFTSLSRAWLWRHHNVITIDAKKNTAHHLMPDRYKDHSQMGWNQSHSDTCQEQCSSRQVTAWYRIGSFYLVLTAFDDNSIFILKNLYIWWCLQTCMYITYPYDK